MLGIFGKWGSGKTYFVKQLKKQLNNERHFVTFSAWKYQTTPAVWAHLYETIFEAYTSNNVFIRSCRKLCYAIYKRWIQLLFIVATCILFFLFAPSDWEKPALIVGIILLLLVFYSSYGNQIEKLWSQIKHIIKRKSFQPLMGIQLEVERELSSLLKHWIGSAKKGKLILFIDDLDRCSLDRIVELIDSLRVVLENPTIRQRMVVLAAIDEQRLAHAIHDKIGKTFSNKTHCNETISEYIDKLFVSGIKIAPLCIDKRSEYVNKLIDADTSIEEKVAEPAEKERRSITVEPSTKNPSSPTGRAEPLTTVRSINKEEIRTVMLNEVKEFRLKLSPRQIKIFYYRLRLAINLYKIHSDTGNLSTLAQAIRLQTEVNHYGFAANQQQASSTRGKTSEQPDRQQKLNELLDADKALKDVVQMVVCY